MDGFVGYAVRVGRNRSVTVAARSLSRSRDRDGAVAAKPTSSVLRHWLLAACLALLAACGSPPEDVPWKAYEFRGTIVQLQPTDQIAIVEHEAIGDWMGAMKMGFPVRDAAEFAKLHEGAKIKATLQTQGYETYYLEAIEVLQE